jgi:hypothetical protein
MIASSLYLDQHPQQRKFLCFYDHKVNFRSIRPKTLHHLNHPWLARSNSDWSMMSPFKSWSVTPTPTSPILAMEETSMFTLIHPLGVEASVRKLVVGLCYVWLLWMIETKTQFFLVVYSNILLSGVDRVSRWFRREWIDSVINVVPN